jgi:hypothetical protein
MGVPPKCCARPKQSRLHPTCFIHEMAAPTKEHKRTRPQIGRQEAGLRICCMATDRQTDKKRACTRLLHGQVGGGGGMPPLASSLETEVADAQPLHNRIFGPYLAPIHTMDRGVGEGAAHAALPTALE